MESITNGISSFTSNLGSSNQRLAVAVKKKSKKLEHPGSLSVHKISLKEKKISVPGCRRFSYGKETSKHNKTIMVLGATGAGKSTLINGMMNHILGVEWEDPFRFKLVDEGQSKSQAHRQTSEVTVYKINHQDGFKIDYSLTIVDTPGCGDTRGIKRDKEITEQLRNLFSDQLGVSEIDAVCFVAQAALARLTPSQKYVFDSVLSIFGKDVAENIRVLVTFADGQRPPVLEAINASGVPCPKTKDGLPVHFKFNNSALFADNKSSAAGSMRDDDDGDDEGFDQMLWNMGTKRMKKFFDALTEIKTKPMRMEDLKDRQQLEESIKKLFIQTEEEGALEEPKGKYVGAAEVKTYVQALIAKLLLEFKPQVTTMEVVTCCKCLISFKKKTLTSDLLSTSEYIDLLIEGEQSEAKHGWKQRVKFLMNMRDVDNDDGDDDDDDDDDFGDDEVILMMKKLMKNMGKILNLMSRYIEKEDDDANEEEGDVDEKHFFFFMTKLLTKMLMT